jgi:hypothetical protein
LKNESIGKYKVERVKKAKKEVGSNKFSGFSNKGIKEPYLLGFEKGRNKIDSAHFL